LNIGILTIGDELTSGRIQNTNAAWIASRMQRQGWNVASMLSVGDTEDSIGRAIDTFPDHCQAVVVTGGLGPTPDDITAKAVADACGLPLIKNDWVLASIKDRAEACGFRWREALERQALFPQGAEVIPNPVGSAWGFSLIHRGCLFIVLPGVPTEATRMVTDYVIPLLRRIDPGPPSAAVSRTLKFFGITESDIEEKIRPLTPEDGSVRIGFYPQFPEVHLVLTARHRREDQARKNLFVVEEAIAKALKPYLFGRDEETLAGVVGALLTAKGLTLAVAESCTGGLITDRMTDVSGSSLYLERGAVTYSNASKIALLNVPPEILAEHGAVSEPTAKRMAEGIRTAAGVYFGLSTTGIAGPTGAVPEKPVGTVYIALATPSGTVCRHFVFHRDRRNVKVAAAHTALMMLREYLIPLPGAE
jgi:nicotinamide-nucleotide amidase